MLLVKIISSIKKVPELAEDFLKQMEKKELRSSPLMFNFVNVLAHYPQSETRDALLAKYTEDINLIRLPAD